MYVKQIGGKNLTVILIRADNNGLAKRMQMEPMITFIFKLGNP